MRRQAIERLLPAVYQRAATPPGNVLGAVLDVMEGMHEPDESLLEHVDDLFTAYRTAEQLVPFLAGWVALDGELPVPVGRLRDLVAESVLLARWRGTPTGLCRFLSLATGVAGFEVVEPADRPFHFVVRVPAAAAPQVTLVRRIVTREKPAATTFHIELAGEDTRRRGTRTRRS
jgi:phage tail-like protein